MIAGAAAAGTFGWSGVTLALPLALAFPALWAAAPTRVIAIAVSAAYFLAASRGLPQGVMTFYGSGIVWGGVLWIAACLAFVAVHGVLWSVQPGWGRAGRFGLASVLMAVPPLGIVGWAHPLTAAGVLFPGWGWLGLAVAATSMLALTTRLWPVAALALGGAWLWSASLIWAPPPEPDAWRGVDTTMGASLGRAADLDQHRALLAQVQVRAEAGARVVVLPESALGVWTPTVSQFWMSALRETRVVVIAGAAVVDRDGYDNALVEIADQARVLYRERMPVPVSMWQPWRSWVGDGSSARAHVFANPIVTSQGRPIAPLICYEQLLLWPVLQSMLHAPDLIVATGNGWWAARTSVVGIQRASVEAWARLFGVPLVTAFNM